jgi:hypothetical protein
MQTSPGCHRTSNSCGRLSSCGGYLWLSVESGAGTHFFKCKAGEFIEIKKGKVRTGGMAEVVGCLLCEVKALSSNPSPTKYIYI